MSKHHKPQLTASELCALTREDGVLFHTGKGKPVELPQALAPLSDTHGHLTHFREHDPVQALVRAAQAGVRLLVVPLDPTDDATDAAATLAWLDELEEKASGSLAAAEGMPSSVVALPLIKIVAGTHPYGAPKLNAAPLAQLDVLLASPRCVGVGEFGFDFGPWSDVPAEAQREAFRTQLRIAKEHGMPVELHLRDEPNGDAHTGHKLALEELTREGLPEAGVDLHCFTRGPEIMKPFTELGCRIAFGGAATFNASEDIRAAIAECPEELLLSETDSPYMAPVPLRGLECEPAMVALNAACIAETREAAGAAPKQQTYAALWNNALSFFGLQDDAAAEGASR